MFVMEDSGLKVMRKQNSGIMDEKFDLFQFSMHVFSEEMPSVK